MSDLVFGAGTDYALLLVARYREELHRFADPHDGVRRVIRGCVGFLSPATTTPTSSAGALPVGIHVPTDVCRFVFLRLLSLGGRGILAAGASTSAASAAATATTALARLALGRSFLGPGLLD